MKERKRERLNCGTPSLPVYRLIYHVTFFIKAHVCEGSELSRFFVSPKASK